VQGRAAGVKAVNSGHLVHLFFTSSPAASLADMSESTWKRARKPDFAGELTKDQLLRLSAVIGIYKSLEVYFSEPRART